MLPTEIPSGLYVPRFAESVTQTGSSFPSLVASPSSLKEETSWYTPPANYHQHLPIQIPCQFPFDFIPRRFRIVGAEV